MSKKVFCDILCEFCGIYLRRPLGRTSGCVLIFLEVCVRVGWGAFLKRNAAEEYIYTTSIVARVKPENEVWCVLLRSRVFLSRSHVFYCVRARFACM